MPLIKDVLKNKIEIFANQLSPLFQGFPNSIKENSEKWADAIDFYANSVVPISSNSIEAKKIMLNIMKGLADPVSEIELPLPFTMYYFSPEKRMNMFNRYLVDTINYKPDPILDRSIVFEKLNRIRETYNKQKPYVALSVDDIFYNQKRFNQIYKDDILNKRKFPLKSDGVTVNINVNGGIYNHIPVNKDGIIVPLQEDGIIGDDTIRYWPTVAFALYQEDQSKKWDNIYSKIPFITQPNINGDIVIRKILLDNQPHYTQFSISNYNFKKDFIDKGLSKDYTSIILDQTQSDIDKKSFGRKDNTAYYITEYEKNHISCDPFWIKNKIFTLTEYMSFLKLKKIEYEAKPEIQKNGIKTLENAIIAYAQQLAIGMAPNFTGAQNSILSFQSVLDKGLNNGSNEQCVSILVSTIHNYFKSGIATNNSTGVTTSWQ